MSRPLLRAEWPAELQHDFEAGEFNGCVGSVLVSETDMLRVWHLRIPAGKRSGFHRHVLNYFFTAMSAGHARTFYEDGLVVEAEVHEGLTKHIAFNAGEHMVHCVENIGDTDLLFTTVEFLSSPNPALPVPDHVRSEITT